VEELEERCETKEKKLAKSKTKNEAELKKRDDKEKSLRQAVSEKDKELSSQRQTIQAPRIYENHMM